MFFIINTDKSEGLDERVVEICEEAVSVWKLSRQSGNWSRHYFFLCAMRKLFYLGCFLFSALHLSAQDFSDKPNPAESKYSLSYGMGVSIPMARFASNDVTLSDAGFAQPAVLYRLRIQAKPKPFWLLGFQMNYASHAFNNEPFQRLISNGGSIESWEADRWSCLRFLGEAGGVLSSGPIDLNARFMLGMSITQYPQTRSVQIIGTTAYNVLEDADPAINLTVGTGFSCFYRFSKWHIGGYLDYLYHEADYTVRTSVVGTGTVNTYTYDQQVSVLNLGLQVGIHF
ncbi:hypothetical protein KFE98_18180 [bacterium SCSIO 12741]|nr:hypothetical protein KFE98_18180 [bacterium SCSIO 12741]